MQSEIQDNLIDIFTDVKAPFSGSINDWAKLHVNLPEGIYAQPGPVDFSTSPWLIEPLKAVQDPKVDMVIKIAARQTAKSATDEVTIPYWISQSPGPILRVHQDDEAASISVDTRLLPILRNCDEVAPLLPYAEIKKGLIRFPNMFLRSAGDKESIGNSLTIRYLIMDEAHLYDVGLIQKFIGRTVAFIGRRKIIISSTPNEHGSELEKYYLQGNVYEWQWCCPSCKQFNQYNVHKQRPDGTYGGLNFVTILKPDNETTDIIESAKSTWLECFHCGHHVEDTLPNRRMLNNTGQYICIKNDGDPSIKCFTWPGFVNINQTFSSFIIQYLNAKKMLTNEDMITFVTRDCLGRFFKADPTADHSKIMRGDYTPDPNDKDKDWVKIMTVDVQRTGLVKYYVIRAWNKNGNESKRLAFGICRSWDEVDEISKKWGVRIPCVGVDCGDGMTQSQVFQECIKHGKAEKYGNIFTYDRWASLKGDQAISYSHGSGKDEVKRYYKETQKGDPMFPIGHKLKVFSADLILWSNYSIKTILMQLRDNKLPGIKWLVDFKDQEYENQMYSEGLVYELDKRKGVTVPRWKNADGNNHFLDCEGMNLVMAIRANVFSAVKVDENELMRLVPKENKSEETKK